MNLPEQRIEEAHAQQLAAERAVEAAHQNVHIAERELALYVQEIIRLEDLSRKQIAVALESMRSYVETLSVSSVLPSILVFEETEAERLRSLSRIAAQARTALEKAQEQNRVARDAHATARDVEQLGLALVRDEV